MNSSLFGLKLVKATCRVNPLLVFDVLRLELITTSYTPLANTLPLVSVAACFMSTTLNFRILMLLKFDRMA